MSVRRLAAEQPESFAFSEQMQEQVRFWLGKYPPERKRSAVIPLLWLVQKQEGWVSEPSMRVVADMLDLAYIRVLEVATFYTMFQLEPVGRYLVQVCGTTPCRLRGAEDVMDVCKRRIGPKDHTSADGLFTWQEVECMGACVNAPMAAINDYYYEDLTAESTERLLDDLAAGRDPKPGSYGGRHRSEPLGGATTLSEPSLFDGTRAKKIDKLPNSDPQPATAS